MARRRPVDEGPRSLEPDGDDGHGGAGPEELPRAFFPAHVVARLVAATIDVAVVAAALAAVPQPFPPVLVVLVFVGYHWLWTWWLGRTLGKAVLGLRVQRLAGPVSWWWALGRSGPGYLVLSVAGLGWVTAIRDAYRRPLYDVLLGGVVVQDVDRAGRTTGPVDRLLVYARDHRQALAERKEPLSLMAGLWVAVTKGAGSVAKVLQVLRGEPIAASTGTSLSTWASGQAAAAVSAATSAAAIAAVAVVPATDGLGEWLMSDRYWGPRTAAIQGFDVAIGDTIEPGRPTAGAGTLEAEGEQDRFRFAGRAGERVVVDVTDLGGEGEGCGAWQLTLELLAPGDTHLASAYPSIYGCVAYGPFELATDGTHALLVEGGDAARGAVTGSYRFRLLATDDAVEAIGIGPDPVAGRVEVPRSTVAYRFAGRAGQQVVIDVTDLGGGGEGCGGWHVTWELRAPGGERLGSAPAWLYGCVVYGPFELPRDGTYTLAVEGGDGSNGATTGSYRFRLLASSG